MIFLAYRITAIHPSEIASNVEFSMHLDLTEIGLEILNGLHKHNSCLGCV
jgi:hypothetical protein